MKALRKNERQRFHDVCRKIREALHLEHWKVCYQFTKLDKTDSSGRHTVACFHVQIGRRIHIEIGEVFFEADATEQLRALLHEHCHAMQNGYMYVLQEITKKAVHESEWEQWRERFNHENEQCTDHLEAVLYELLKDRF